MDCDVLHEGDIVIVAYGDDPLAAQLGGLDIPRRAHLLATARGVTVRAHDTAEELLGLAAVPRD
eukprot:2414435-Alexandrium_andersonii.AAC.1